MRRIGRRRSRRVPLAASAAVVIAAVALGLGGCGGDDGGGADGAAGGTPPAAGQAPAAGAELTACLEENGIEVPSGGMPDQETIARIQEACGDLMPQGGGGPPGGMDPTAIADCLRDAGIDVPEGGDPSALMGAIDPSDPDVSAALQACGFGPPGS